MKKYEFYYPTQPKSLTKYLLCSLLAIFVLIVTYFALTELRNFYCDEPTIVRILMDSFKSSKEDETTHGNLNKNILKSNLNKEQNIEEFPKLLRKQEALNTERLARETSDSNSNSTALKTNVYYEEQTPAIVYSKTDIDSSIAHRQMAEVPPRQDKAEIEEDPYRTALEEDYETGDDNDYFGEQEPITEQNLQPYYRQQLPQPTQNNYYTQMQQQQQPQQYVPPYYKQQPSNYYQSAPNSPYYDDSREDLSGPENLEEARTAQHQNYPNYYTNRQYPFGTPPPARVGGSSNNKRLIDVNSPDYRKTQLASTTKIQQSSPDPYPTYVDDYDYMPPHSYRPQYPQRTYANYPLPLRVPQYHNPTTTAPAIQKQEPDQQIDYLTIFRSLKTMWDLYQSFTSSWNTIAERRNREEELAKQKYKQQQQIRINSRQPPKFNNRRNSTVTTKSPRRKTTTSTTEASTPDSVEKKNLAKVEPRKGSKGDKGSIKEREGLRDKRQAKVDDRKSTEVSQGRYIKGDPLKGYYDFVITEGSYKFWAAFQVGTAILIIYSTFAAIYYSKVNPLVSDYDYTDYLGGARSLSDGDVDFVDDDDGGTNTKLQSKSWLEWMPRTGNSLKFILDAIDKLPTDHKTDLRKYELSKKLEERDEIKETTTERDYIDDDYRDDVRETDSIESINTEQNWSEIRENNKAM